MAESKNRYYERLNDEGKLVRCRQNDYDGEITGRIVYNVPAWFDENPEEARRLGWTKHITHTVKELREMYPDIDPCRQALLKSVRVIDEWTVEDAYHVIERSEEMMTQAEISQLGSAHIDLLGYDGDEEIEGTIWI